MGGVYILPNSKHLNRALLATDQQRRTIGCIITRLFVSKQHVYLLWEPLQERVLLASFGNRDTERTNWLTIFTCNRRL